jgi:hypothetical protein
MPDHKPLLELIIDVARLKLMFNDHKNKQISMLLMHVHILFAQKQHKFHLLNELKQLCDSPDKFVNAYLPSMPHDEDFEVILKVKEISRHPDQASKFYKCQNGHIYTIGDCTRPATTSTCPTCKVPIGGLAYKLVAGNEPVDENMAAKDECGYFVNDTNSLKNIRNMGMVNTTIVILLNFQLFNLIITLIN